MTGWPLKKLRVVLEKNLEKASLEPQELYHEVTVKLWGQGVKSRGRIKGLQVNTNRNFVRTNQFIFSKIDARHGALGIVPPGLDGAIVSNDFPSYFIDESLCYPKFLEWMSRSNFFVELCKTSSEGTTNRVRLKESRFLERDIPLPPLLEQNNVVNFLDMIADKVRQVEERLAAAEAKADQVLALMFQHTIENAPFKLMAEVAPLVRRRVEIKPYDHYPELGIRSFGKGTFHKPAISGIDLGTKRLFRIENGDLLFSNVFAWEGAIAIAQPSDHGRFGSHRFITCVADKDYALASFLRYYLLSPEGMEKINEASPGGAGRNRTLGLNKLMQIAIPIPSLAKQRAFDQLQMKIAELKSKHEAIRTGLSKLMPSMLEHIFGGQVFQAPENRVASKVPRQDEPLFSLVPEPNLLQQKAAVAAYITNTCHDNDFGKTKLAKCYYLLHERLELGLTADFQREAAGPWDKEQDAFLDYASQQGWLKLPPAKRLSANDAKDERLFKAVLVGQNIQNGVDEAFGVIGSERRSTADKLLGEMKKMHWELLERWATVLDSAKVLRAQGENITASTIRQFISSIPKWTKHKLRNKPQHYTLQAINETLTDLRKWGFLS